MRLSVAICTYNRAQLLANTLDHLRRLNVPAGCSWELLVVANACTDATLDVLSGFAGRLPLHVIHERRPGLSHARNAAVAVATGDYVLWTDDDAWVDRKWMEQYVDAFRTRPYAAFFGGPIDLELEPTPPPWLVEVLPVVGTAFARRNLGGVAFQLDYGALPYGANMAIKTTAQRRHQYDPRLGRGRGGVGVGEETDVLYRLLAAGEVGWWVPGARVTHFIPRARQTWRYLKAHWKAQGRAEATELVIPGPRLLGRALPLWQVAIQAQFTYALARVTQSPVGWVAAMANAHRSWARLRAAPGGGQTTRGVDSVCARSASTQTSTVNPRRNNVSRFL
jgi:glucosyl-dolichyl phosphate glucuronosyltransferase